MLSDKQYKKIIDSLYTLAIGTEEVETTEDKRLNEAKGIFETIAIKEKHNIIQPNVTAIIKLLELQNNSKSDIDDEISRMSDDELRQYKIKLAKQILKEENLR